MPQSITILPETTGTTLCLNLTGVITPDDFRAYFEKPLLEILNRHNHYSLLVHYDSGFVRWEESAADLSFKCISACSSRARRCAYVNPPDSRIMMMKLLTPVMTEAEIRYFNSDQYDEALSWVLNATDGA